MIFLLLFSGISVNDEILSQYNPLFIVNSKTNVRYDWIKCDDDKSPRISAEKNVKKRCTKWGRIFNAIQNKNSNLWIQKLENLGNDINITIEALSRGARTPSVTFSAFRPPRAIQIDHA